VTGDGPFTPPNVLRLIRSAPRPLETAA